MTDYAAIARKVREDFVRQRAEFVRRIVRRETDLAREARRLAAEAADAIDPLGDPEAQAVAAERRIRAAESRITAHVTTTIEGATTHVREPRINLGLVAGTEPRTFNTAPVEAARAQSARQVDPALRFRARAEASRREVVRGVREGLARGASVRQMAQSIARTDTVKIPIPRYLETIIAGLRPGMSPAELARLAEPARAAARRMGQATDAQSWRTLRPSVTRLAEAVAQGHVDRAIALVNEQVGERLRFEAARIARTEAARASNRAQIESARNTPGVEAVRWQLSAQHPIEDICDAFAEADLYGLGPGVYPLDQAPDLPAHPNCLCTLVPVITRDSILRAIRGEPPPAPAEPKHESVNAWLRAQSRETQTAIVGARGAALLRDGTEMVSPTGQVRPVYEVTGAPPPVRETRTVQVTGGQAGPLIPTES